MQTNVESHEPSNKPLPTTSLPLSGADQPPTATAVEVSPPTHTAIGGSTDEASQRRPGSDDAAAAVSTTTVTTEEAAMSAAAHEMILGADACHEPAPVAALLEWRSAPSPNNASGGTASHPSCLSANRNGEITICLSCFAPLPPSTNASTTDADAPTLLVIHALRIVVLGIILGLMFAVAYFLLNTVILPGGWLFAILYNITASWIFGTVLTKSTGLPILVGVLLGGLLCANLTPTLSKGFPTLFVSLVRTFAVTLILSRGAMTFKWSVIRPVAPALLAMGTLPFAAEVTTHALVWNWWFQPPSFLFALFQASTAAPVSNAIVLPVTAPMRAEGYSATRGPLPLMIVSAALDNTMALSMISLAMSLLYPVSPTVSASTELMWMPVIIGGGAVVGAVVGFVLSLIIMWLRRPLLHSADETLPINANRIAATPPSVAASAALVRRISVALILSTNLFMNLLSSRFKLPIAGIVCVVASTSMLSQRLSGGRHESTRSDIIADLALLWDYGVTPCLFSIVGAQLNLADFMSANLIGGALLSLLVGLCAKAIVVLVIMRSRMSLKESVLACLGWSCKATIQSATASRLYNEVVKTQSATSDALVAEPSPSLASDATIDPAILFARQWELSAARATMDCIYLCTLVCSVSGAIAVRVLGRRLLVKET